MSALRGVLLAAERLNLDTAPWLDELQIDRATLADPEARVAEATYHRAWQLLSNASNDALLGLHLGANATLDAFDVVGHLVARSATVGEGLERVVTYSRLLHDAGRIEVEVHGRTARIHPGCKGLVRRWPRQIAEYAAAATVALIRSQTGKPVCARAVTFEHHPPDGRLRTAEYLRAFGVAPAFDAVETVVELDAAVLKLPVLSSEPGVLTFLDAYARRAMERLPKDDRFASQVERAIAENMARGLPALSDIAHALAVTTRTLQRRLAREETSFAALVDSVRRELAETYLADRRLAISEISFLLGFAEPGNFHRAFRRWTGRTPRQVRARTK